MLLILAASSSATAAPVDLLVAGNVAFASAGGSAVLSYRIGNDGAPSTGPVQFTLATPPYVNIDRTRLPAECRFLYENLDRTVSEIVACTLPGLTTGERRSLAIGVTVDALAPAGVIIAVANVLPAAGVNDVDVDIESNRAPTGVIVGRSARISGRTNLALSGDVPALGGPMPATLTLVVGNNGSAPTAGAVTLSMTTPFFVNVDHSRPLPAGCRMLFQNPTPGVPEIVQCIIPAGLAPGSSRAIGVPLALVPGGPFGILAATSAVRVDDDSGDVDPDRSDNFYIADVLVLTPLPASPTMMSRDATTRVVDMTPGPAEDSPLGNAVGGEAAASALPILRSDVTASAATGARIDLNLSATQAIAVPGGTAVHELTVGNAGENATGAVRLVYALPLFVNVDRSQPLPGVCTFLFQNVDFTIQEIVECVVPGPARGQIVPLAIPLVFSLDAPRGNYQGRVVLTPAAGSADVEQFVPDNAVRVSVGVLRSPPRPPASGNLVDLYLTVGYPNVLTNRPAIQSLVVSNKGPNATQGVTHVTLTTPVYVNIDRARSLPAGCGFLYENTDPAVPEVVECLIASPIPPGGRVVLPLPLRLLPGGPTGRIATSAIVRPLAGSPDVEHSLIDNFISPGVVASALPLHTLRFFLHTRDVPGTAGGFTMSSMPAAPTSTLSLLNAPRWFSDPALVGTFDAEATFRVVRPCLLGLALIETYTLSATDINGGSERQLGQTSRLVSLCLGLQIVSIPVLTPAPLDGERLKLTISTPLGVLLSPGPSTYLEATSFAGVP